jgi:MYXO-CTERM domain-containing protein
MSWSGGFNTYLGAVYMFERSGDLWIETAALKAPSSIDYDHFGEAVALEGDLLVVGAPYIDQEPGAVFTFARAGGAWVAEAKLAAIDGLGTPKFGSSVSLSGNTVIVGDPDSGGDGAAYVFVRDAGVWSQEARIAWIEAPEGPHGSYIVVAVSADTAVVARGTRARVFGREGAAWSEQADVNDEQSIGALALDGDTALFGSYWGCSVFSRSGGVWSKEVNLWPLQNVGYGYFGASVAIEGDRALVGTADKYTNGSVPGFAYTFRRAGGAWEQEAVVTLNEPMSNGCFGASVALSGDTVLLGAPCEDAVFSEGGAAYALVLAPGLEDGAPCDKAAQCASGFCSDGVCCDALCEGTCLSCSGVKKGGGVDGVCAPVAAGIDPDAECAEQAKTSCGTTGVCNGSGACEKYAFGTACDDGDACTEGDVCVEGGCAGEARSCAPPGACHLAGQCNATTGVCEYELINPSDPDCAPESCGCSVPGDERASDARWLLAVVTLMAARRGRRRPQVQ